MKYNKKLIIILIIITVIIIAAIISTLFLNKKEPNGANREHLRAYFQNKIITDISQATSLDPSKPIVILFYANYCKTCHDFMPAFKKLSKDYAQTYNFGMLNIQDPVNYPIVDGNVGGIPSLYIFDSEIGNKVHISLSGIHSYNGLKEELDRYLRIRSFIDIEKAKAEQQKLMQAYLEEITKNYNAQNNENKGVQ